MAPSLGVLEAKVQGHDDECNDKEEQEHGPEWAKSSGGEVGDEDEGGRETGEVGVDEDNGKRIGGDTTGGEDTGDEEIKIVRN